MIGYIWFSMMLIAVITGVYQGTLDQVIAQVPIAAEKSFTLVLSLGGIMTFWLGIMKIAEDAGLVVLLGNLTRPLLSKLFPSIPLDHPAMGAITLNISANMLGLNNAATPFGLKAMRELETLNPNPSSASDDMCMLLAINTSSVQLIPTTAIGLLSLAGATSASDIILSSILATSVSTVVAITAAKLYARLYPS